MANATTSSSARRAKTNLFKDAAKKTVDEIKNGDIKGVTLQLPEGRETLHKAVTDIIVATREKSDAENKLNLAKGELGKYAHDEFIRETVKKGSALPGPVKFVNERNESVTYCCVDKSKQYPLDNEQIENIEDLLSAEAAKAIIRTDMTYSFSPQVMAESVSSGETVKDVIADLLSAAIMKSTKLTDEQKKNLIVCHQTKRLIPGVHKDAVKICGGKFEKVKALFTICKTQICRYLQA